MCYERVADEGGLESYRTQCANAYLSEGAPELGAVREAVRRGLAVGVAGDAYLVHRRSGCGGSINVVSILFLRETA